MIRVCSQSTAEGTSCRSTRTCVPRAATARWSGRWPATGRTTSAGRRRGSSRHCSRPGRWPAIPRSAPPTRGDHAAGLAGGRARQLRRGHPRHAPPGESARCPRARPAASSSSVPAGCATSSSRCSCCSSCTAAATTRSAARPPCPRWRRSPTAATSGRADAASLAAAYRFLRSVEHRSSCASCAAPTPCPTTRPRCAGSAGRWGFSRDPTPVGRADRAAWRQHAAEVRRLHEKLFYRPLLEAVARLPERGGQADAGGGAGPAGGAGLRRSGRGAAPPRGAHLRRLPPGGDPAHPAAGDARLVRRRGQPRRRAARVPPGQRRPRQHPLVPAAAARRRRTVARADGPGAGRQPVRDRPAAAAAGDGGHPGRGRRARPPPGRRPAGRGRRGRAQARRARRDAVAAVRALRRRELLRTATADLLGLSDGRGDRGGADRRDRGGA